jgi:hypothetical protein
MGLIGVRYTSAGLRLNCALRRFPRGFRLFRGFEAVHDVTAKWDRGEDLGEYEIPEEVMAYCQAISTSSTTPAFSRT